MYLITHFARQPSDEGCWIMVGYVTRDKEGVYHLGIEKIHGFTQEDMDKRVSQGPLIEINPPVDLDPKDDVSLWLQGSDDRAKVWLASSLSPMNDPAKKLVWEGALFASLS